MGDSDAGSADGAPRKGTPPKGAGEVPSAEEMDATEIVEAEGGGAAEGRPPAGAAAAQRYDHEAAPAGGGDEMECEAGEQEEGPGGEVDDRPCDHKGGRAGDQMACGDDEGEGGNLASPVLITRPSSSKGNKGPLVCQVQGCNRDLSQEKKYYKRYRVCMDHLKMQAICVDGKLQRFCQQCGRFHDLSHFDGDKRNCRERLNQHNRRRRKSKRGAASTGAAGSDGSWDDASPLSPVSGRIVKVPRGRRSRRQMPFGRYPGSLWVCDDTNVDSTEEAVACKDTVLGEAVRAHAYRSSSAGRESSQNQDHPQSRFGVHGSSGFQRSQVQVGGARSAFKTLIKGEDGQNIVASIPKSQGALEAACGSAGIDYQVVLDQIVPTDADGLVSGDVRGAQDVEQADALLRAKAEAVTPGQPQQPLSKGQSPVATVPIILIPAASAAQLVQGLQVGGGGTVALIPTNDNNAIGLTSQDVTSPVQQQLQAALAHSLAPSGTALQGLGSNMPVIVQSAPSIVPSLPCQQKTPVDVGVGHSEALARPIANSPYAITLALQSGVPMCQKPTTDALTAAAALHGSHMSPSHVNELKRLVVSGTQGGQFGGLSQVMVTPGGVANQGMDIGTLGGSPHILQAAVNLPQQRVVALDKATNQYMMTVLPAEGGNVHLSHAK
ncbi:unnamed protein product [Ostreobium quekettii]|uniref:SBP-type domain-containing protein n=1 Tax=Ostreobium quekettii TaxID=121088 RepID=A0A8S1J6J4_9CHLO|nr:unnamed protein product [Ostreobium quekettii]